MQWKRSLRRSLVLVSAVAVIAVAWTASGARAAGNRGTVSGVIRATPARFLPSTVVYLRQVPGHYAPRTLQMDQQHMRFVPHVLPITVGDTVRFLNHDHIDHNVFSPEGGYNLGIFGYDQSRTYTFGRMGVFTQLCSLHPEMVAFIFVGQNPYAAVPDASGHFTIPNVPPGSYQVAVWNVSLHAADQHVTIAPGHTAELSFDLAR